MRRLVLMTVLASALTVGCSTVHTIKIMPDGSRIESTDRYVLMKMKDKKFDDTLIYSQLGMPEYETKWSVAESGGDTEMVKAIHAAFLAGMKQAAMGALVP